MGSFPYPEVRTVCGLCEQPWEAHLRLSRNDLLREADYEDDEPLTSAEILDGVTALHCVSLLKIANRGPAGPPGVQGPMGLRGEPR
jgi:hypothetical protein